MKTPRPISLSGAIRKRLPDIEQKMFEGVRQSVIVEELAAEGFAMSLADFRQLLYRARNAKKPAEKMAARAAALGSSKAKKTKSQLPQDGPPENKVETSTNKPKIDKEELRKLLDDE